MLDVLLESRSVRTPRPVVEATLSAVAHGVFFALMLAGTSMANRARIESEHKEELTQAMYIVPPDRAGPPQSERLQYVAAGKKGRDLETSEAGVKPDKTQSATTDHNQTDVALRRAQLVDNAYSVLDVDSAAVRDPSSAAPAYPPAMMNLAIEGAATIKFVVDTTGRVDLGTVQTLTATNPAFAHAVLDALPRMRFRPARMGAHPVRQTAQEEFKFQLLRLSSGRP